MVNSDLFTEVYVKTKYVDLNDIENPFKTVILQPKKMFSKKFRRSYYSAKIQINEVFLEDSYWFYLYPPEPKRILTMNEISLESILDAENTDFPGTYGSQILIDLNPKVEQYKRNVLTFLEVTGILGGIFELFEIIIGFLVGILTSYHFKRDLRAEIRVQEEKYQQLKNQIDDIQKNSREPLQESVKENFNYQNRGIPEEEEKHNLSDNFEHDFKNLFDPMQNDIRVHEAKQNKKAVSIFIHLNCKFIQ